MTLKFDNIAISFLARVKGSFKTTFTPGTAMPDADFLTAEQIISYVNKALLKLFNDIWVQSKGDIRVFSEVIPELVVSRSITMAAITGGSEYLIAAPNLDFYRLIEASGDGAFGVIGKKHLFQAIKTGSVLQYSGTSLNPIFVNISNYIYCFPEKTSVEMTIIKQPIDPTSGYQLTQNGTYDSPYASHWQDRLIELAYGSYLKDSTLQS